MVQTTSSFCDVLIIGAGVMGMLSALELAEAGQTVVILDKGQAGLEASWAGGGIISPLYPWRYSPPITALATWSQNAFPELIAQLRDSTGIDPELLANGMLVTATNEREQALAWGAGVSRAVIEITDDEAQALEPQVVLDETPLWMPRVSSVRNPRMGQALRQMCLNRPHIQLLEHHEAQVSGSLSSPVVSSHGQQVVADRIVLTTGAWTGGLLSGLDFTCPIKPMKGQMLLFSPCRLINRVVLANGRYAIPRMDGRIVFGSTLEDVGFQRTPDRYALESLHASALAMIPGLNGVDLEAQWAGFRPGSPEGMPWIGAISEKLWVNSGHFRNGVVLSPASSRLLCDLMLDRTPIVDPLPYQPRNKL
ncbi:MAG: FAD-dependent oxidoreductase [Pseudomonadota bacterium]|nr:FAD-dependent oxidoreductase [Pseudomonadota bacterium]